MLCRFGKPIKTDAAACGKIDAKDVKSFKTAGTRAKAKKLFDLKAEGEFNQSIKATINGRFFFFLALVGPRHCV